MDAIAERAPARGNGGLSRPQIVTAALQILERDGYDALTMRSLAAELGVRAASLYWHVADKAQLEDWLFDALLAEIELIIAGLDWRDDLRSIARQLRRGLVRRRDAQRILAGRFVIGPHLLARMETALGVLRRAGLDGQDAAYGLYAILTYVNGFVLFQTASLAGGHAVGAGRSAILARVRDQLSALPAEAYRDSVVLAADLTSNDADGRFEFGLDLLLRGLARRAKRLRNAKKRKDKEKGRG